MTLPPKEDSGRNSYKDGQAKTRLHDAAVEPLLQDLCTFFLGVLIGLRFILARQLLDLFFE